MNIFKKIYYNKYSKQSYSLSNVDLIVDRLFKNKEKGIYIDVGCNHPIKYNNTYLLHKRGWVGINAVSYTHLTCRRPYLCRSRWSPYH